MKLTSTKTRTRVLKKTKTINKSKTIILDDKSVRLVSMALLNTEHIEKLTELYNKNRSTETVWTEEQIKQFVIDEKIQIKKPDIDRKYYGFCIFYNNILTGYIIGKKTPLLAKNLLGNSQLPNKFNLLFTIGLDENFQSKGIGTRSIDLFIKMYHKKLAHLGNYARKARLYADIAANNIASIRAFEKNNFHYSHNIIISGKPYRRYSRFVFID